jgi:N-terminal domain of reverse transcriptase
MRTTIQNEAFTLLQQGEQPTPGLITETHLLGLPAVVQAHTSSANGTEKQTDWNAINWRKANRAVRHLRQRIFRAAQEGNLNQVRSLQKLMLKSYSNRLVSMRRVTQINAGKDTPGVDKLVLKTPAARGKMVDVLAHFSLCKAKPTRRVCIVRFVHLKRLARTRNRGQASQ